MKKQHAIFYAVAFVFSSLLSCSVLKYNIGNQNLASIYDPARQAFDFKHKTFFINDSTLRIFYSFNTSDLLYIKENDIEEHKAIVRLHFLISNSYDSRVTPDTTGFSLVFKQKETPEIYKSFYDVALKSGRNYMLLTTIKDVNRKSTQIKLSEINHLNFSQADFYLTDHLENIV
jgi:hypothetical protein